MAKNKKSKKTVRSKQKYPQFKKRMSPKVRAEYMDYADGEFADSLPEDEFVTLPNGKEVSVKEWYHKFVSEWDGASLDYKNLENNLHNTKELKKDCTDRNNARNRCIYGIHKAKGKVIDEEVSKAHLSRDTSSNPEDVIIEIMDGLREGDED